MDTTLIINPGSSSKKYALYQNGREVFSVSYEQTKDGFGKCISVGSERNVCESSTAIHYHDALAETCALAVARGCISRCEDITRVGVRIVAPGTFFTTNRVIEGTYMTHLREVAVFAPLHIPHQIEEIERVQALLPHTRVLGVSDSAFHATITERARQYSIPRAEVQQFDMYRFGHHGLSVASVMRRVTDERGAMPERAIVCHVGSGVSVTALKHGKSIDTTMGFAPTSGLMMGTRGADIDVAAVFYMIARHGGDVRAVEHIINDESGLKGLLGSSDLRVALDRRARGDVRGILGVSMYVEGIRKAIGAYTALLGGIDMLILTATAPERNPEVRALLTERFEYLGVHIDGTKNESLGSRAGSISASHSQVEVRVVHTDEMGEMARIAKVM